MRATVIGAAGFVGARLAGELRRRGAEVWAPGKGDPQVLQRDLGTCFYCAGLTADYDLRPYDTVEAHVSLLNDLARAGRFDRLVYCSSTRLYDGQEGDAADEDAALQLEPANPRHTYDLSKALGENIALTRTGGRGAVARLSNVFDWSEGAPGFLSEWLIRARTERDLDLDSSPFVERDYIHLDEVVAGLIALAGSDQAAIVNLASGELVANHEIASVFADAGRAVRFLRDTRPPAPPRASAERLRALGVAPTPVRVVVARYLKDMA